MSHCRHCGYGAPLRLGLIERCPGLPLNRASPAYVALVVIPHAHQDEHLGLVCVRPGEPLNSILHELAHVQEPFCGHGPAWRARMEALGLDPDRFYFTEREG